MTAAMAAILTRSHWVFDLDGTLTVAVHDFAAIRAHLGVPAGSDILAYLAGLPAREGRLLHARLDAIEDELAGRAEAAPGAVRLVESLARRHVRLGIVTRNTRRVARRVLASIGVARHFPADCVIGRHDAVPKPDPDGILRLAARWQAPGAALVMVGDYLFDLQTGRAAGAATILVDRSGNFRWPELTDLGVTSLEELADRLDAVAPVDQSPRSRANICSERS